MASPSKDLAMSSLYAAAIVRRILFKLEHYIFFLHAPGRHLVLDRLLQLQIIAHPTEKRSVRCLVLHLDDQCIALHPFHRELAISFVVYLLLLRNTRAKVLATRG